MREGIGETVSQPLPWVPVPAESKNIGSSETDASPESPSGSDDLVMQSLSWIQI